MTIPLKRRRRDPNTRFVRRTGSRNPSTGRAMTKDLEEAHV